jgi:hypothetical protein
LLIEKAEDRCSVKYKLLALILGKMGRGKDNPTSLGAELVDRKPLKARLDTRLIFIHNIKQLNHFYQVNNSRAEQLEDSMPQIRKPDKSYFQLPLILTTYFHQSNINVIFPSSS